MLVFTKDVVEISKLLVDNTKLIGEYASFVASNLNKMPDLYNFFYEILWRNRIGNKKT
mgnify:FL=1